MSAFTNFGPFILGTPGPTNPVGIYTSYTLLCQKYGAINITRWSNHDNADQNPDFYNITLGISTGESLFNQFWNNGPFFVPLSPVLPIVSDWATTFVAYWLYTTRGLFEMTEDSVGNKLQLGYNLALNQMAQFKGSTSVMSLGCARRWPSPTAAVPSFRGPR